MNKTLSLNRAITEVKRLKQQGKRIVLVGGCFDVLHFGHVRFLERAKKEGSLWQDSDSAKQNILIVLLESDEKVRMLKGEGRPIFSQKERAEMLVALSCVDIVILLPTFLEDKEYFELTKSISPDVIAITEDDPLIEKKGKQAEKVGGEVRVVTPRLKKYSTNRMIKELVKREK